MINQYALRYRPDQRPTLDELRLQTDLWTDMCTRAVLSSCSGSAQEYADAAHTFDTHYARLLFNYPQEDPARYSEGTVVLIDDSGF